MLKDYYTRETIYLSQMLKDYYTRETESALFIDHINPKVIEKGKFQCPATVSHAYIQPYTAIY